MKIQLSKYYINKCWQFAEESVDSSLNHYRARNQNARRNKIIQDICVGKMGELAVYFYLERLEPSKPDFQIYTRANKSFDPDLLTAKRSLRIHCKSQSLESSESYGKSWILQFSGNGSGHKDKLFKQRSNEDYIALTNVDLHNGEVKVLGVYKINDLFENDLVKLPKLKWLERTKRAIYFTDIKESGIKRLRL